jgi:crossover junction endodeoxyribonuclease RuvC
MRILGIDPGSRMTGWGLVQFKDQKLTYISSGTLFLQKEPTFQSRLLKLHKELQKIMETYQPEHVSLERVFVAKNADSALKLGHARGVILLTAGLKDLCVSEYAPTEVKQALTGQGRAAKEQVQAVLTMLLGPQTFKTLDASDALALCVCHCFRKKYDQLSSRHAFDQKTPPPLDTPGRSVRRGLRHKGPRRPAL